MQYFNVSVQLGGDRNHVVTNKGPVSVAEIAVLQAIHGRESVSDFRAVEVAKPLSHRELREELTRVYQNAMPMSGGDKIVDKLFGPHGALPTTLGHIGIDAQGEAKKLRAAAKAAEAAAKKLDALPTDEAAEAFLHEDAA
jgi:hypothetical protein